MKVLLIAHSISPLRGSEPGLSWNWASYLSRDHAIWVISHPEFQAEVEQQLANHPNPNLNIIWIRGSNWDPASGTRGIGIHYVKWLRQAERFAKQLHSRISFDIAHHVSFGTVSVPSKFWQLGIPFIWGPVGGAQTTPQCLVGLFGSSRYREYARTLRVKLLPYLPSLRKAVRRAAALLATNYETQSALRAAGAKDVPLFWDNGLPDHAIPPQPEFRSPGTPIKILWAAKLEKRKGLPLALQALTLLDPDVPVVLEIAGDGPERSGCMSLAADLGVSDRVHFIGNVPSTEMRHRFKAADIFLFTSIRDSCASVVLEAMAHALPIITLDLHGVGAYMPAGAGIKVPVTNAAQIAQDVAGAIRDLALDAQLRLEKGFEGWMYATDRKWSTRADMMTKIYQNCLERQFKPSLSPIPYNA